MRIKEWFVGKIMQGKLPQVISHLHVCAVWEVARVDCYRQAEVKTLMCSLISSLGNISHTLAF